MSAEVAPDGVISGPQAAAPAEWRLGTRVAFRFCCVYLTLYVLLTQMFFSLFGGVLGRLPWPGGFAALRGLTSWIATDLFGFSKPLTMQSGSGDKPYDWALSFMLMISAAISTAVWSIVDRKRPNYAGLHPWFRLFLRFALGGTMLTYGMIKAIPSQMPFPRLTRLLEPYGQFSLMGVLWSQIGASPAYEMFTGMVEIIVAILLFTPGLTLPGALLGLAASIQVFILNMTYDVPVKLFSFHLVAMSLVLLAPDFQRLTNLLVLNRPASPSPEPPLALNRRNSRITTAAQLAYAAWLFWVSYSGTMHSYRNGLAEPKTPLYGIWNVETMIVDGQIRPPLLTDNDRWRRVVVEDASGIVFQRMDDTFTYYGAKVDIAARTITLTKAVSKPANSPGQDSVSGRLTFEQVSKVRLILDGEMEGKQVRLELQAYDRSKFRLLQSRFRWVQDYPFNR